MDRNERIEYAKAILTNPLYIEKMAELTVQFFNEWKNTKVLDTVVREECWKMLKVKEKFEAIISMCAIDETKEPEIPTTDYDTG